MNYFVRNLRHIATACMAAVVGITAVAIFGQETVPMHELKAAHKMETKGFCSNNNWSGDKVSFTDLREMTIPASGAVNVDSGGNGGISVKGEERGDVLVRACVQAWGKSDEEAKAVAASIKIATGGSIKAENTNSDQNWSVSYQILVPRSTNLDLKAHNGGISISGVDGSAEFQTTNGGVNLSNVAGSMKGRTTNGGVNVTLTGTTWKGAGLDLQTTNGGVKLTMPENYAANIETGTVNGGYRSDIPALNITTEDTKGDTWTRHRPRRIQTNINGGGAPIKIITTNGGVNISTTSGETKVM